MDAPYHTSAPAQAFSNRAAFSRKSHSSGCQARMVVRTTDLTVTPVAEHALNVKEYTRWIPSHTVPSVPRCNGSNSVSPAPGTPLFDKLALEWWIASDRGDRRLATRTLVPKKLHTTLATSPSGKDPAMHAKDFDSALVKRNRALTQLIEDANKYLHDNPPGAIGPPVTRNNFFDSLGEFSTSRGHAPRDPPKYAPPPALPAAVLTPPKRKASDQPQQKKRPPPPGTAQASKAQRSATRSGRLPAAYWPPSPPPSPPCVTPT